jgi:hypothetical protein
MFSLKLVIDISNLSYFVDFFIECKDEWMIIVMIDVELQLIIVHY